MDWTDVWEAIDERRLNLGWSLNELYRQTGVSETTFRSMRQGQPLARKDKQHSLLAALQWPQDAFDVILGGGTVKSSPARRNTRPGDPSGPSDELNQLRAQVAELDAEMEVLSKAVLRLLVFAHQLPDADELSDAVQFARSADRDRQTAV